MPINVTKTSEAEQLLKIMTGLQFNPYNEQGVDVRARIISCPDPDWQGLLTTVFFAVKQAFDFAECVDNVREAIKRAQTHYHVIADDVEDHFNLLNRAVLAISNLMAVAPGLYDQFPNAFKELEEVVQAWEELRRENDLLKVEELAAELE